MKGIITICLIFSCLILYAEEPIKKEDKKTKIISSYPTSHMLAQNEGVIYQEQGLYIDASPGISAIKNSNLSSDIWNSENSLGYHFNMGFFRSVSPLVKVKLGLGFSSYSTHLSAEGEVQSPELADIDNDNYFETLTLSNVEYDIKPMYLTIPLVIELGNANLNKIGYYFDFGFEYAYLINANSSASGSYSSKGTYPKWGVTLENVPELGFYSERNLDSELDMPKSNYSLKGGGGITVPLSGLIIFKIGVTGHLGLKDLGNKQVKNPDSSPISQQAHEFRSKYINNPVTSAKGSKTLYTGIEFGFYISKRVK